MQNEKSQFNNENKKYFTIVPNYVVDHSISHEKSLYLVMKRLAGENGTCWASPITLGRILGVSPNTVRKYRKILVKKNWIKKVGQRGKTKPSDEYKIVNIWKLNEQFYNKKESSTNELSMRKFNDCANKVQPVNLQSSTIGNKEDNDKKMNYKERSNINNFKPKNQEEYLCQEMAIKLGEKSMDFILHALKKYGFDAVQRAFNDTKEMSQTRKIENKGAYFNQILKRSKK
ncbi:MAG: helix-turn-helix domain-containing protein [Candidatus Kuenenbacteria bacterium]